MLLAAFAGLSVAVLLGLFLAGTHPADRGGFAHWPVVHGTAGACGVAALLLAWQRAALSGAFGLDAVALTGAALLAGLAMAWITWRGRRLPLALLALHAAFGGIGTLIVAGFALG